MSSDSEFESTQSTIVAPPSSKRRKFDLRPLPSDSKIPALFAPGGSLDSQTTDSQWAEINFGPESQPMEAQEIGDGPGGHSQPDEVLPEGDLEHSTRCKSDKYLLSQVIRIIDLCTENAIRNLNTMKDDEIKSLQDRCTFLEGQLRSISARNSAICQEISREREWIHLLQQSLQDHGIPYPPYPVYK
ncbi:hypothetical protein BJ912DRAFT_941729 [Pholiota molesta]|nr:hypothetical protein BJ912DRAFT_941729 [Pholiota molesta]